MRKFYRGRVGNLQCHIDRKRTVKYLVSVVRFSDKTIPPIMWLALSSSSRLHQEWISVLDSFVIRLGLDEGLLGNEDSIEEFTLILATNSADLLNLGAGERKSLVVDTIEDKFTLDIVRVSDLGGASHNDKLVLLSTEEVLDGDAGAVLGDNDVNGEMSVYKSHLVAEALLKVTK